jgi:hypothetical protein
MTHLFQPFPSLPPRSSLITNPPTTVPSVEDLLSLQKELQTLGTKTDERVKKAETDIKTLDTVRRKSKDKDRDTKLHLKRESSVSLKHATPDAEDSIPSSRVGSQPRNLPPPKPKL